MVSPIDPGRLDSPQNGAKTLIGLNSMHNAIIKRVDVRAGYPSVSIFAEVAEVRVHSTDDQGLPSLYSEEDGLKIG